MDDFWKIIDDARVLSGLSSPPLADERTGEDAAGQNGSADPDRLRELLEHLPNERVATFASEFARLHAELNRWSLWGAGYVVAGGMSDDGFHYFRSWIIGMGRDVYDLAIADPDALGPFIGDPEVENEELEYVAMMILEDRGVEDSEDSPEESESGGETHGEPFDEETVEGLYPRLAARFGGDA